MELEGAGVGLARQLADQSITSTLASTAHAIPPVRFPFTFQCVMFYASTAVFSHYISSMISISCVPVYVVVSNSNIGFGIGCRCEFLKEKQWELWGGKILPKFSLLRMESYRIADTDI